MPQAVLPPPAAPPVLAPPPAPSPLLAPPPSPAPPAPPVPAPTSQSVTSELDPLEDLELEEAIDRIRRREQRRRYGRRSALAVGIVAVLIVLFAGGWLVFHDWRSGRPAQVRRPAPPSNAAVTPPASAPEPKAALAETQHAPAPEPAAPPETPYIGAMAGLPETTTEQAASEVERELPARAVSPREESPKAPARGLPRASEVLPPRRERPQPQPEPGPSASASRARPGPIDREVRVEIASEALGDGLTSYTVRLRERDGRPVTNATVSIRGRRADGALLEAMLDRAPEPGAYRAVVRRPAELTEARLRVASVDRVQEVPLPDTPR
jgi:hypothetical protein